MKVTKSTSFPLGSNIYSAVHIASQGLLAFDGPQSMASAALDPLSSEAFLAPMNGIAGIVPAEGGSLSYYISPTNFVVTWNNVYACRTNLYPISYQAELKDSGDFSYRFAFSSNFVNSVVATNFNIAAFNHGNGERYSFDATNSGATVRELHWKAFLPVEPGVLDHDGDGLSSAAELFYYGTDISKSDTDGDGVSDYDEVINPAVYDPLNPDSDGDSLVDSMDPQPGIYNDPSAVDPVDGYTLGFKVVHLGPAGAVMSFATDSDGDGFEDWKELLAGTLINDPSSRPAADDGVATLFSATITLASTLPEPVLLTLGGRRVMLREPGSTTLWLNEGVANTLSLRAVHGCDVSGLSITIDSPYAAYAGNDNPFNGTIRLRSGEQTGYGMVVQPAISTASNWICFHDEPTRNARAFVLPEDCPGNPEWAENGSNFTIADSDSLNAVLNWYGAPGCDHLYFEYCLPGAAARRNAYVHVTRCAGHGSSTSSESSSAAVAVNNDDDNGNGTDDLSDSTVEGENDLYESRPIYGHAQSCCPCYGYGPNPDIIATRTYCSGRLRTYTSPSKISQKTAAFPGDSVFVEGREASETVGVEKIVWSWLEEGEAKASTNYYTIFSVRLFGDLDFDNDIDSVDYAAFNALTEYGWGMPVESNALRKVELKTDVLIPGYKILSLSGGANIRIWTTPNPTINDTPLLITGQTVTNGFGGASFGASPTSMLYVEALDSGVATLTYSYVGTGSAEGFGCSAEMGVTAVEVELCSVVLDADGHPYISPENGKVIPGQPIGFDDVRVTTYVPLEDRGIPQTLSFIDSEANTIVLELDGSNAYLRISRSSVDGYKTWELDYTNTIQNIDYFQWDGVSNYVHLAFSNDSQSCTADVNIVILDEDFTGAGVPVTNSIQLYSDSDLPGYYSNYSITEPREDIGMPAFSDHNAFVIRMEPFGMDINSLSVSIETPDETFNIPLSQYSGGSYVSCLVVPVPYEDGDIDLGFESTVNVVKIKLKKDKLYGWDKASINIESLGASARKIASGNIKAGNAMLITGVVSNEKFASQRATKAVVESGEVARQRLKYGVTPIFTPSKDQILNQLEKHSVWIHSGHGGNKDGIQIVKKVGSKYELSVFKASDINLQGIAYDLVFMNTCESTDRLFVPEINELAVPPEAMSWKELSVTSTAVMDIGTTLNAKNYIGWDTWVQREISVKIPKMLMEALDSGNDGDPITVADAVTAVKEKLEREKPNYYWFNDYLNHKTQDDSVILDLNKKAF